MAGWKRVFGGAPAVVARAPGRVNLIGEHTDYNDGFVLPFAIAPSVEALAGPADRGEITVYSAAEDESVTFSTGVSEPADRSPWQNYVRGVVAGLREVGIAEPGAKLYVGGDLPPGSGLASSAALCIATALALLRLAGKELDRLTIARLAQRAEHDFAGTPCGIMDPYVSLFARSGHALLIDCRARTHEYVPTNLPGVQVAIVDTGSRHQLSSGLYGQRVADCAAAVSLMADLQTTRRADSPIKALRDVSPEMLQAHLAKLTPVAARRARHVVKENARVHDVAAALRRGDASGVGQCLDAGHRSLRDDYEVSSPPVEEVWRLAREVPGVLGARMTGGGFGGMLIVLVRDDAVGRLRSALRDCSRDERSTAPSVTLVAPEGGAQCSALTG